MFKNVLVAVDGSSASKRGFSMALAFAKDQNAALHVVHVVEQGVIATTIDGACYAPPDYVDTMLAARRDSGTSLLRKLAAAAAKQGRTASTAIVENLGTTVACAVLRHARKVHADIIVMGTHGRRGMRRLVMGSDAEAVVRESRVPVLLVRAAPRAARPTLARARVLRRAQHTTTPAVGASAIP